MKNKELLIHILLMLRSKGINNEKILCAVEKIPPHYFLNLLGNNNHRKKINFDEISCLLNILQISINKKSKINNVLISSLKCGWYFSLVSLIAKRVYGFCSEQKQITKVECIFKYLKLPNIFLKRSSNYIDWIKVAPFDLIILFECFKEIPTKYLELLDHDGLLFFTKENKSKVCIIQCSKNKQVQILGNNDFLLTDSNII